MLDGKGLLLVSGDLSGSLQNRLSKVTHLDLSGAGDVPALANMMWKKTSECW